jgi:hypothetical protein
MTMLLAFFLIVVNTALTVVTIVIAGYVASGGTAP